MMCDLNCAILMRALMKSNLLIRTLIINSIRLFLRNLVNLLMIALLGLSLSWVPYVLMVLLHILIMNVLNSCYMLETHIVMSNLIFRVAHTLVLRLALLLVLCLVSFMDLTIAHMVLVHERIALCLDALVTAHILIVVIAPRVGMVILLECLTPALSPYTYMVHTFSVMVHVTLVQRV
jgi:hypothetical protein